MFMLDDDPKRLRQRAVDCRNLAKSARTTGGAATLEKMAEEFEDEARRVEGEAKPFVALDRS